MAIRHKRAAHARDVDGGVRGVMLGGVDTLDATPNRPLDQHFSEFLTEPERAQVREVWWNLQAAGVRLPAERGIVALNGGAR